MTYTVTEQTLNQLRSGLSWLIEDGYIEERARLLRSRCGLRLRGPNGRVSVTVSPSWEVFEIILEVRGRPRAFMQAFLKAHGLPSPPSDLRMANQEELDAAITAQFSALKQLRYSELQGNTSGQPPLPKPDGSFERRLKWVLEVGERARQNPQQ